MIFRTMKFKSQPSLVYCLEHSGPFEVADELIITSLLRAAGMVEMITFGQDPRDCLVDIKKYWPQAENIFFFDRQSVLAWECTDCGMTLPRCGGSSRDIQVCGRCVKQMNGVARIGGLPWSN